MKSEAEIAARRALKERAVTAILAIAQTKPLSAALGQRLEAREAGLQYKLTSDLGKILNEPTAHATFTTAKGCTQLPRGIATGYGPAVAPRNFYDFLLASRTADCLGSYMNDAWRWAVQIMRENPHSFPHSDPAWNVVRMVRAAEVRHKEVVVGWGRGTAMPSINY